MENFNMKITPKGIWIWEHQDAMRDDGSIKWWWNAWYKIGWVWWPKYYILISAIIGGSIGAALALYKP